MTDRMTVRTGWALLAQVVAVSILFSHCDESLPPRDDPTHFLDASIESIAGPVPVMDGVAQGVRGGFHIELRNAYSEVLQGKPFVHTTVDVWMKDHPDRRGTAVFTSPQLINSKSSPGFITIGVDSAAILIGQWSHTTAAGKPFWQYVDLFPDATTTGVPFCRSDTVRLFAQASIQLFENVQPVPTQPIAFSLVYQVFGLPSCKPE